MSTNDVIVVGAGHNAAMVVKEDYEKGLFKKIS